MFITISKCLLCDGGLSPGSCCEITELDWHPFIQEDCMFFLVYIQQDVHFTQEHTWAEAGCQEAKPRAPRPSPPWWVPQLIEGSKSCHPEVKASKSDKRLRSYSHLKITIHFRLCSVKSSLSNRMIRQIALTF